MKAPKFICHAARWFDKVNGNTYHSVRITRFSDGATLYGPMEYGYENQYQTTALSLMAANKWIPRKYRENIWKYERENGYPILWEVRDGLKRECIENGKHKYRENEPGTLFKIIVKRNETMNGKHTPGPWNVQQQDPYAPVFILGPEPENRFIARMGWGFDHGDSSTKHDRQREIEDARLISACPVMYEFIQRLADEGNTEAESLIKQINA